MICNISIHGTCTKAFVQIDDRGWQNSVCTENSNWCRTTITLSPVIAVFRSNSDSLYTSKKKKKRPSPSNHLFLLYTSQERGTPQGNTHRHNQHKHTVIFQNAHEQYISRESERKRESQTLAWAKASFGGSPTEALIASFHERPRSLGRLLPLHLQGRHTPASGKRTYSHGKPSNNTKTMNKFIHFVACSNTEATGTTGKTASITCVLFKCEY